MANANYTAIRQIMENNGVHAFGTYSDKRANNVQRVKFGVVSTPAQNVIDAVIAAAAESGYVLVFWHAHTTPGFVLRVQK